MRFSPAQVETMDGARRPGRPLRFTFEGGSVEVRAVRAHWYEAYTDPSFHPDEYFMVESTHETVYLLRYSTLFSSWWVRREGGGGT
ncbi:MAG TPA: hypothetical protein PLS81_12695 [Deltaproteobacteria bacterium]|nr:hypothetical protein [Deltaproteobacteria bacterium]HOM30295.1 hypothetical protein [Deltaproteobacteria bacterium]HPP80403.1 hypothetical protein [Deltaproteobacteria bacterium]